MDAKPSNVKTKSNIFEEEMVESEKEKMRKQLVADKEGMKSFIKTLTPADIFILFDEDDSGLISFEEFRKMLPYLDVNINDAKALRYFKICDTDGSGEIDIDEFKVALFICDPTSGNSVGFTPSKYLTPMDAFETFDEAKKGSIDEDEFFYALEYLRIPITDEQHEELFAKFDLDHSGTIDFDEFREAFLLVCDLRAELEDRGIDAPALTRASTLRKILRLALYEEENKERRALAEAIRFKKWIMAVRGKKKVLQNASHRAYQELRSSLDLGGHVYIFGGGTHNQFDAPVTSQLKSKQYTFEHFDRVTELWRDRVQPAQLVDRLRLDRKVEEQEAKRDAERDLGGLSELKKLTTPKTIIDPFLEAQCSPFHGKNTAMNTAALWGRRVHSVTLSESVMFALTDTGEIYASGGNNHWWHEIQPDSLYQTKWRGDTTPRSQLLLGTVDKSIPIDNSLEHSLVETLSPEEKKLEVVKTVAKYYNVWEPPPNSATRMIYLEKDMMPKIKFDDMVFSLQCRGKKLQDRTKTQLCEELYADIVLEKKLLGERAHKAIKELEVQVTSLIKRKKKPMADKIMKRVIDMWKPLLEVQAEERAADLAKKVAEAHYAELRMEESYLDWRHRMMKKRDDLQPKYTPRGNSLAIDISGVTPRGPVISTPRGFQAAIQISAGAAHACLVHKTGQLYSWGIGAAGRLGLDSTEAGDAQKDVVQPRVVQALYGRPVLRVSCGYSHTGAIIAGGELYMWGSANSGKCGLGRVVESEECYCSVPTKVMIGPEDRRIRKLSCGSAHTAVVTELGHLYVFGCGDGGRLGLGPGRYFTMYEPTLVECLLHEHIATVSCGNTTTLCATEIKHEWVGDDAEKLRMLGGGRVYMAGSRIVLGKQCDIFTQIEELRGKSIKQVSCGFQHSLVVTAEGELLCWGRNKNGCCGVSPSIHFIEKPMPVDCLYAVPKNLALGKRAYQSSTFNSRDAKYAVDGITTGDGLKECSSTHNDNQAWLEVDLGQICVVDTIKLWNRSDPPHDSFVPRDYYSSRLFPCWVMVGQEPFDEELGAYPMKNNLRRSMAKVRFTEDHRLSQWRLPTNTQVRYVRVQLEGVNNLCIAQLEVFGHLGISTSVGRVSQAVAGREVTVAVIRASQDPRDTEIAYKRATYSDSENADILRQFETYALEFDKFGRGEVLQQNDCLICRGKEKCEICTLKELYGEEIEKMPPAVGGRRRRLRSIDEFLIHANKPEVEPIVVAKKERPSKWELRKEWLRKFFGFKVKESINAISVEEAMNQDPVQMLEDIRPNTDGGAGAAGDSTGDMSSQLTSTFGGKEKKKKDKTAHLSRKQAEKLAGKVSQTDGEDDAMTIDSLGNSVVDLKRNRRGPSGNGARGSRGAIAAAGGIAAAGEGVGDGANARPVILPGDVLATGHVVKGAYPKSLMKLADM